MRLKQNVSNLVQANCRLLLVTSALSVSWSEELDEEGKNRHQILPQKHFRFYRQIASIIEYIQQFVKNFLRDKNFL